MPHGYLATIYSAAWLTNWNAQEKARNRIVNVRIAPLTWIVSPLITKAQVSARRAHPTTHLDPAGQLAKFHRQKGLLGVSLSDKCGSILPGDTIMPHFRCYLLNSMDSIVSVDSVEAGDDAGAMELAGQLILERHAQFAAIEVWDRARCVGKILSPESKPCLDSLLKIS